jgi:hypothetical protein
VKITKKQTKSKFMLKKRLINALFIIISITAQAKFGSSQDSLAVTKVITDELGHYSIEVPVEALVQVVNKDGKNMITLNVFEGDFPYGILISESDSISDYYKKITSSDRYKEKIFTIRGKQVVGYQTKSSVIIVERIGGKQYSFLVNTRKRLSEHESELNQVLQILNTFKVLSKG